MEAAADKVLYALVDSFYEDAVLLCFCSLLDRCMTDTHISVFTHINLKTVRKSLATLQFAGIVSAHHDVHNRYQTRWYINRAEALKRVRCTWTSMLKESKHDASKASDSDTWQCSACSRSVRTIDIIGQIQEGADELKCPMCAGELHQPDSSSAAQTVRELEQFLDRIVDAESKLTSSPSRMSA